MESNSQSDQNDAEIQRLRAIEAAYNETQKYRARADALTDHKGYTSKHWVEALILELEKLQRSSK